MKKLVAIVGIVAVMVTMLAITGCETKRTEELRSIETGYSSGVNNGEIKWSRFHYYGTNSYDQAIEWRTYRKDQGDVVSEISSDYGHGIRTYWFTAGKIAE